SFDHPVTPVSAKLEKAMTYDTAETKKLAERWFCILNHRFYYPIFSSYRFRVKLQIPCPVPYTLIGHIGLETKANLNYKRAFTQRLLNKVYCDTSCIKLARCLEGSPNKFFRDQVGIKFNTSGSGSSEVVLSGPSREPKCPATNYVYPYIPLIPRNKVLKQHIPPFSRKLLSLPN